MGESDKQPVDVDAGLVMRKIQGLAKGALVEALGGEDAARSVLGDRYSDMPTPRLPNTVAHAGEQGLRMVISFVPVVEEQG